MKYLKPTIFALTLTMIVSSTAVAGNIAGLRATGNIGGLRNAGNIGGPRSAGISSNAPVMNPEPFRFDLESTVSGTFAAVIRMLLDGGALL